ncbi:hypothetical protein BDC45DRAFT_603689 [Circinella umbellata]|nr:hypothetical protein BDC45DRAFT_603689 [Circinella umbellata]
MPSLNMFVLERVAKASIPITAANAYHSSDIVNLLWILKLDMKQTHQSINDLKQSHNNYMIKKASDDLKEYEIRSDLRHVVGNKVVKPVHGAGFAVLLAKSFTQSGHSEDLK